MNALGHIALSLTLSLLPAMALADTLETPLELGEILIDTLDPADNLYSGNSLQEIEGFDGAIESVNETRCASFVTRLYQRSYGIDYTGWMGCDSPNAARYHKTIEDEHHFIQLTNIADIAPGDIIAIKYLDCPPTSCGSSGSCASGHVATVYEAPVASWTSISPIINGTSQYTVRVMDQTSSPHGSTDTRHINEPAPTGFEEGAGYGTMRLYTNNAGEIVGHTWTTSSGSTYRDDSDRPLVIGRFSPKGTPAVDLPGDIDSGTGGGADGTGAGYDGSSAGYDGSSAGYDGKDEGTAGDSDPRSGDTSTGSAGDYAGTQTPTPTPECGTLIR